MKKLLFIAAAAVAFAACQQPAPVTMEWHRTIMDGSLTGVQAVNADNMDTALGTFEDDVYVAPNGRRFSGGSTPEVAAALMEVQPKLLRLKQVIGYSSQEMEVETPECGLSNWFVDELRAAGTRIFKVPMDFAIANFGGIRCALPAGPIILDDIESMFPFVNHVVYAKVPGSELKRLLDFLATTETFQCISGAKVVVKDHKIVSATVGGKPIVDKKIYNVATIDFLLTGGDQIAIGAMAKDVKMSDYLLKTMMTDACLRLTKAGKNIEYSKDGRVIMED